MEDVYRLKVALYMYRLVNTSEILPLRSIIELEYPSHFFNTRLRDNLIAPFPRTESIRMNFRHQFIKIWNSVPTHIKSSNSLRLFKKNFKKFLINDY